MLIKKQPNDPNSHYVAVDYYCRTFSSIWAGQVYFDGQSAQTLLSAANRFSNFALRQNTCNPPRGFTNWNGSIILFDVIENPAADPQLVACGGVQTRGSQKNPMDDSVFVRINGATRNLKIQKNAAFGKLKEKKLKQAQQLFEPIALIPDQIRDTASSVVKHFIDFARIVCKTPGNAVNTRSEKNGWLPETLVLPNQTLENTIISLMPNPTSQTFDIVLAQGDYDIQVFDALGKLVFSKNTEGVTTVDVRTWQNGLYMVSLLDKNSKKKTFSKVVVQH